MKMGKGDSIGKLLKKMRESTLFYDSVSEMHYKFIYIYILLRVKNELLSAVVASLQRRFKCVESEKVLQAACCILDPREWPKDAEALANHGSDELLLLTNHFAEVLDHMGCDRNTARHMEWQSAKVLIKSLLPGLQKDAWRDFFMDDHCKNEYKNLLLIIELLLVLPLSTAACERGFSSMKRIKNDWRSSLSVDSLHKLLFISIEGPELDSFSGQRVVERWYSQTERARRVLL